MKKESKKVVRKTEKWEKETISCLVSEPQLVRHLSLNEDLMKKWEAQERIPNFCEFFKNIEKIIEMKELCRLWEKEMNLCWYI